MSELIADARAGAGGFARRLRILGILVASIVAATVPAMFAEFLYTPEGISTNGLITHLLLPTAGMLIALLIVLVARRTGTVGNLELVWFRRGRFEAAAVLFLPVVAMLAIATTIALVYGLGLKWKDNHAFTADGRGVAFFVALTIGIAVVGPILQEVFWRGYVQRGFERIVGAFPALITQAVFFATVHIRPLAGLAPIFVFGLLAGIWRWRRRTLGPIIVTHMILNGLFCAAHWPHWLDCTKIRVTSDYVAKMAQVVRPPDYDPNTDARDWYERASLAVVEMPEALGQYRRGFPENWPEGIFEQLRTWVAANETALELAAEGAGKPYYCPVYAGPTAMLAGMPDATGMLRLAFALDTRIKLRAFDGQDAPLVADMTTLHRLACHLGGNRVLSHQRLGLGLRALMTGTIRGILASESLEPQTLTAMQVQLEQLADADRNVWDFGLERLIWHDGIQRVFTDDGDGRGRVPRAVITGAGILHGSVGGLIDPMTPEQNTAFLGLSRERTTRCTDEFFRHIEVASAMTPWDFHHEPNGVKSVLKGLLQENTYVAILGNASLSVLDLPWRARADLDALVATIAAMRYEAEHGEYPESLMQLVEAGFLRQAPRDPYSNDTMVYKCGDDGFLLYSRGLDFDDDGGVPSRWGDGPDGGDQVFWPIR